MCDSGQFVLKSWQAGGTHPTGMLSCCDFFSQGTWSTDEIGQFENIFKVAVPT